MRILFLRCGVRGSSILFTLHIYRNKAVFPAVDYTKNNLLAVRLMFRDSTVIIDFADNRVILLYLILLLNIH